MGYFLTETGYDVIACADGELALNAFHAHPSIDILLTDIEMPRKSGLELARELSLSDPFLPVLIVSGSILSDETWQEMQDRKWGYMSKPCLLPQLLATLQSLPRLGKAQPTQPLSHFI
jgi:DNA-binding NtrC family response regulator